MHPFLRIVLDEGRAILVFVSASINGIINTLRCRSVRKNMTRMSGTAGRAKAGAGVKERMAKGSERHVDGGCPFLFFVCLRSADYMWYVTTIAMLNLSRPLQRHGHPCPDIFLSGRPSQHLSVYDPALGYKYFDATRFGLEKGADGTQCEDHSTPSYDK
jgi:hypothetical protein